MEPPDETLLFLDFQSPLPSNLLQSKVFLRLADLEGPRPLVQVNDMIYQGSYGHSIGTNLFFRKTANEGPPEFPFLDPVPFKLQLAGTQTKMLECSQMIIPSSGDNLLSAQEDVKFNLNWDYKELLERFKVGTLDLQDMIAKETDECEEVADEQESSKEDPQLGLDHVPDVGLSDELEEMYSRLLVLARTPVRHAMAQGEVECEPQFRQEYEYKATEAKVLCRPLFVYLKPSKEGDLQGIDSENCRALGLLSRASLQAETLLEADKSRVMRVENFDNLDLPRRYAVLLSHAEELERQISANSPEENLVKDEFGRTALDTLNVLNRLLAGLQKRVQGMKNLQVSDSNMLLGGPTS